MLGDVNVISLEEFNNKYVEVSQGYRNKYTDEIIFCPHDIGFNVTDEECNKELKCSNCWDKAIKEMEKNSKSKNMKADAKIITTPVFVVVECPKCSNEISYKYDEFISSMPSENITDWINKKIKCHECGQEIEIDDVEWE